MWLIGEVSIASIVAGLVIIGVGILIADILAKLGRKVVKSFEIDRFIKKFPINDLVSSTIKFLVYIISIVWGVFQMGIEWIVLIIVCGAILILLLWKAVLGLREFIPNYAAYSKLKLKKGKSFNLQGIKGRVKEIGKLESKVRTEDKEILYIPNKLFLKQTK
jgi:small conductance mechanosensitive channel